MDKQEIRRKIRNRKQLVTESERSNAARAVFSALECTAAFMMANRILMYHSLPDELSTLEFLDKWHSRKQFFLPRVNGADLELLPYERASLRPGAFRIEEPTEGTPVNPEEMELIIVPAVALDRKGNRLGRGKGFYDRLLATTKATTVGVAYDFQLLDELPVEPHDTPVHIVITESHRLVTRQSEHGRYKEHGYQR